MKKVLILAYDFPPYVSVGGLRPFSWYKYLHQFGYDPIVVTRQWNNKYGNHLDYIAEGSSDEIITEETEHGLIIKAPYKPNPANKLQLKYGNHKYKVIRKLISAYYELLQYLIAVGPKASIYKAAKNYLKNNRVDVIIATGDPFVLFTYADKLSRKNNIPWIADYRDFWSQYINIRNNFILRNWLEHFEKKSLKSASGVTVVSEFLKTKISELSTNSKFKILPNGYDPQAIDNVSEIRQNNKVLSLAYVGTIYDWHPIRSFLEIFKEVILHSETDIRLNFYGINLDGVTFNGTLEEFIDREFGEITSKIVVHKRMPNSELMKELAGNNVMLLFNYYSYMGTKIFDYMAIKRAILFCYSNDPRSLVLKKKYYNIDEIEGVSNNLQEELIIKNQAGFIAKDEYHLKTILFNLIDEFKMNKSINCTTKDDNSYSRKELTKQLATFFNESLDK